MGLVVDDCDFDINAEGSLGVIGQSIGTSDLSITIQNSTFNALNSFGAGTIQITNATDSTGSNTITGNDLNDTGFTGIIVNNDDDSTSTATISNNTISGDGTTSQNGFGIQVRQDEDGTQTVLIDNNDIDGFGFDHIRLQARDTIDGTGTLNATVTNNDSLDVPNDIGHGINAVSSDSNTLCLDVRSNDPMGSNTFPGFDDDILVAENGSSTLNIEQTSAANIESLNTPPTTVFVGGTPNFGAANCPTP